MNKFEILVNSEFGKNKIRIHQITELTLKKLIQIINVEDFQISIEPFSSNNPNLKISGAADEPHKIWLKLNVSFPDFEDLINNSLTKAIAHEFHHLARKEKIKDWNLLELLVMEGLALHFEKDFCNPEKTFLTSDISNEEYENIKDEIISDLFNEDFDHKFYQNKRDDKMKVPAAFIYRFGYRIVNEYLKKNPEKNAILLYQEPAKSFLPEYFSEKKP